MSTTGGPGAAFAAGNFSNRCHAMKKTTVFWLLAAALATGGAAACKKSHSPAPAGSSGPEWTPGWYVYFAGTDSGGQAVYWKNGQRTLLAPAGVAQGIAVSGSGVYVGGAAYKDIHSKVVTLAALWRDGMEQDLSDTGIGWAYAPAVRGTDVYVPGYISRPAPQNYAAVYWENGQLVVLDSTIRGQATGIAVNGSDVYVIGGVWGAYDTSVVWKNGERLAGAATAFTLAYGQIVVSGTNIYVVGDQGYFENSVNQFTALQNAFSATSIFLNGQDVYVSGARQDSVGNLWAVYWKNGAMDTLANYPGTSSSVASGVVVAGSDVYVAGVAVVNGFSWGVFWKNGAESALSRDGGIYGMALGK